MKTARIFFLLGFSAALGACSSNSSNTVETTGPAKPPKTIAAAYDSAVANNDTSSSAEHEIPRNVRATEYAAPARKDTMSTNK